MKRQEWKKIQTQAGKQRRYKNGRKGRGVEKRTNKINV